MRLYSLTNMYLSPIQQGIQTAHAVHDLFIENLDPTTPAAKKLTEWAMSHKTIIVLNGGNSASLLEAATNLRSLATRLNLPMTTFYEDEQSLNGAMTCVAIVVPEDIYTLEVDPVTNEATNNPLATEEEIQIRLILSQFRLA